MAQNDMAQTDLLRELEPVVEGELNRHYGVAKEWFPHDYVPWSEGRNFDGLMEGDPWSPDDADIPDVARSALIVNLLTEDNLPSYHHEIAVIFGRDAAWGEWVHRWTAEEGRHAIVMRDYMLVKRMVDPVELERFRMTHMSAGYESAHAQDLVRSLAYVSFQELATRVSHRNTGKFTNDPMAERLLARVATDENLHMIFYRNLLNASLQIAPDQTMQGDPRRGQGRSRCRARGSPASSARRSRWPSRASTTSASTTTRSSCRCCATARCSRWTGCPARARRRAPSWRSSSASWTPRPPASSRSATR